MTEIKKLPDYVTPEYLESLKLREGCGSGDPGNRCAWQEARAWVDLDPKSYACPVTASPVLHELTVHLQDSSKIWRKGIARLLPALLFSRGTVEVERRRAARIVDWSLCEILPDAIDATVALCDGGSEQTRELSRLAEELRAKKGADLADRAALAALAALADRAARAALADLADLAALADLADLAARAARADRADLAARAALADLADRAALAALAALADRAARAARAALAARADLAEGEKNIWPKIEALLGEMLAMDGAPNTEAAQENR